MRLFSILFLLLSTCLCKAQSIVPNQFILQLEDQRQQNNFVQDLQALDIDVKKIELIYPSLNIYSLITKSTDQSVPVDINLIAAHSSIVHINHDHYLSLREEPNDPSYPDQWHLDRINASEAWDLSTGGVNYKGDDIVVAVIDNGFDIQHEDLVDNIWINKAEIAGDGIDNDGNGYKDDINGANVFANNGELGIENHGTKVCGVLGAKGNNDLGVSGINWNIKMMLITGQNNAPLESNIVKAYSYAKDARQKYNNTDGKEGAFVVATNSSWGIDYQWAEDFPLWCEVYNDLGETGILSIASTSNTLRDVSILGDMPSTCTSDYLIVVTDVDQSNTLQGGYHSEHVDITAPGSDILTTDIGSTYNIIGGTSAACPQVTGAVALFYSLSCSSILEEDIENSPGMTALKIKSTILENAFLIDDMKGRSTTGGLLDLSASLNALNLVSNRTFSNFGLCHISPNPTNDYIDIHYTYSNNTNHTISLFDYSGKLISEKKIIGAGNNNEEIIDLRTLPRGTYFLHLKDAQSKSTHKISKI